MANDSGPVNLILVGDKICFGADASVVGYELHCALLSDDYSEVLAVLEIDFS